MLTTILTIALSSVGTAGVVWAFVKKVWPVLRRISHFMDDWFGEPERDGRAPQPGVMGRLQQIEATQLAHTRQFEVVLHELFPNSGGSLRDGLNRTEKDVAVIKALLAQQNRG